jgi:hypothetical protein
VAGSPKAQLIIHCLQHELWQNASINALGEISQQQETCGAIFFGQNASIMHWVKLANSRKRVEHYFLGEF